MTMLDLTGLKLNMFNGFKNHYNTQKKEPKYIRGDKTIRLLRKLQDKCERQKEKEGKIAYDYQHSDILSISHT